MCFPRTLGQRLPGRLRLPLPLRLCRALRLGALPPFFPSFRFALHDAFSAEVWPGVSRDMAPGGLDLALGLLPGAEASFGAMGVTPGLGARPGHVAAIKGRTKGRGQVDPTGIPGWPS